MRSLLFAALPLMSLSAPQAQIGPVLSPPQTAASAAAVLDVGAAASGVRSARAPTNPTAFFAPGVTSISGTGEEFLIQQPLEMNGTRRARAGVAKAQLRGAQAQSILSLRDVVFTTKSAYYELARAREQALVAGGALQVAQEFDRIGRRQAEEGARPGIDLAQTGLEVSRAERQVTIADGEVTAAQAVLNTVMGRDPSTPIDALTPFAGPPIASSNSNDVQANTILNQALASRAEIQAGKAAGEQFRQEARLARAEGRPDIVPQFRVGYVTRGLQPVRSGNGAGIGIALTLPFLDYGSRKNRIQQAEQSARAEDSRLAAVQNEIRQQVVQAVARQRAAESVVQTHRGGTLEQAQILLNGSRVGFREGRTSALTR